jgi:hypothetical protein
VSYINRRRPIPPFVCSDPALALFHSARHTMSLAFIAWLNGHPDPTAIDLEADASCSIIRQLVALHRGDTP